MKTSRPAMMPSTEAVECPKCKKHSIVKRSPNLFNCLNCNFQKELPPVSLSSAARMGLYPGQSPRRRQSDFILPGDPNHTSRLNEIRRGLHRGPGYSINGTEPDKLQPFVFAAIAVIFGILLL